MEGTIDEEREDEASHIVAGKVDNDALTFLFLRNLLQAILDIPITFGSPLRPGPCRDQMSTYANQEFSAPNNTAYYKKKYFFNITVTYTV